MFHVKHKVQDDFICKIKIVKNMFHMKHKVQNKFIYKN